MISKIQKLIKKYNKKIDLMSNQIKGLNKFDNTEAYVALFNKIDVYIEMVVDLEEMINKLSKK